VVDVDIPFRELGFSGVPHRQLVLMQPTTDCLVHLSDTPPLVVTLAEVEIAHLERVQFGLKNFDMVFVFKDFSKPVAHVNNIPIDQLENVKEWLDSVDIPFTEGPVNLSWPQIMKTINDDPRAFFEEAGGWGFLSAEPGSDATDSEDEVSEFEDQESEADQVSESDSASAQSEFSSGGDASGSDDEADESGEDWDDLEKQAAKVTRLTRQTSARGNGRLKMKTGPRNANKPISFPDTHTRTSKSSRWHYRSE
jgi:nucleosome binding factor SPN SPT16 subunit